MKPSALAILPALRSDAALISRGIGDVAPTARVSASGTGRITVPGGTRCTVEGDATSCVGCG
ncbi:hypothetical protein [Sphingomonas sp. T1]|uniref:hypothetical protein n=1 Tax=Sphingomonas sp. T1 TaxID=2653172 RepID=UPI00135C1099|nr:hypothetical protein [Sphingomonas sp. T1]